jgi:[acyl-carrier-protein] S-malonyltransferase
MAADVLGRFPEAGEVFAMADGVLGMPLTEICVAGSPEQLRRTEITQPAIVATSLAVLAALRARGFEPAGAAGHSLGEFVALSAAGVLTPAAALHLVRRRGELMARVGKRAPGAMAAVIGLSAQQVERLCALGADGGVAEVANYNDPGQTVLSGHAPSVERVAALALAAGAERVVRLDVGAPFHCSLMREVEAEFGAELDRHDFSEPRLPVFSAVSGDRVSTGTEARELLRRQLTGPVRWIDTLRQAVSHGLDLLVEIGPGRVLAGFAKRTVPDLPVYGTGTARAIDALLARLGTTPHVAARHVAAH